MDSKMTNVLIEAMFNGRHDEPIVLADANCYVNGERLPQGDYIVQSRPGGGINIRSEDTNIPISSKAFGFKRLGNEGIGFMVDNYFNRTKSKTVRFDFQEQPIYQSSADPEYR